MSSHKINNFDIFFVESFGKNKQLISYKTKNLTSAGENYGSLMLAVEITFKDENNIENTVNAVAKMVLDTEFIRMYFRPEITFKKEREIYNTAIPTLRQFIKECGINDLQDIFPKLYGSRLNLFENSNSDVDFDNAIILMENLKLSDYKVVDRLKGFDFIQTKYLLENLAEFHAVPVALKLLKPEVFQEKIMPHLKRLPFLNAINDDDTIEKSIETLLDSFRTMPEYDPYFPRITKSLREGFKNVRTFKAPEPFGTWVHNDYWVNNTMIKFNSENLPIGNKIVDYQGIEYSSPAKDVIFLLFTSVQNQVLKENYDYFIQLYFDKFILVLKKFSCDLSGFTFEQFQNEIELVARKTEFFHIAFMLTPILLPQDTVKHANELNVEEVVTNNSDLYKEKFSLLVQEFVKRKWI